MVRVKHWGRLLLWATVAALAIVAGMACGQEPGDKVLVQFYAENCGPCRAMTPIVRELAAAGYPVRCVNVDVERDMAARYGVTALPCFVLLADGQEQCRIVGRTDRARLEQMLAKPNRARPPQNVQTQGRAAPTPAWRYERPVGHRAAVVRIGCRDRDNGRALGSGVYVRYRERRFVVTASHVVRDARTIDVRFCNGCAARAKILATDNAWDVAVLGLAAEPAGVMPAELEFGAAAMQRAGDGLESCGYGADGKLTCNNGRFLRYVGPAAASASDWLELSGHARQGDSGGPVFNAQGHVVGVLWGTDGAKVVGVQAGRLHIALQAAMAAPHTQSLAAVAAPRNLPNTGQTTSAAGARQSQSAVGKFLLPYRDEAEQRNRAMDARLAHMTDLLLEIQRADAARPTTEPPVLKPAADDKRAEQPATSPLAAALCVLGAVLAGAALYYAAAAAKE